MSALTNLSGDVPWLYDAVIEAPQSPAYLTSGLIDASTEKFAVVGCVWHPTVKTGTINIRKVHFRCGAITFNALSTMRVSLQNVSLTAGPPYQPDGTQDQTYDFVGTGLTSNTWTSTGNLSADRAVDLSAVNVGDANSRWVCAVFEYQTFTAADSIIISTINLQANSMTALIGGQAVLNTGSYALVNSGAICCALECDDGTFAFMDGALPFSAFNNATTANNAAIRACGLRFTVPVPMKIDGFGLGIIIQNGCDGTLTIYDSDGTTVMTSVVIDNDAVAAATLMRLAVARFPPITLLANTAYRAVFVPTTATTAQVFYGDVNTAAIMDGLAGGQTFHWTQRDSGGAWTETTTRRPHFMLKISAVHDGSAGGGLAMPVSGRICA